MNSNNPTSACTRGRGTSDNMAEKGSKRTATDGHMTMGAPGGPHQSVKVSSRGNFQ